MKLGGCMFWGLVAFCVTSPWLVEPSIFRWLSIGLLVLVLWLVFVKIPERPGTSQYPELSRELSEIIGQPMSRGRRLYTRAECIRMCELEIAIAYETRQYHLITPKEHDLERHKKINNGMKYRES